MRFRKCSSSSQKQNKAKYIHYISVLVLLTFVHTSAFSLKTRTFWCDFANRPHLNAPKR